MNTDPVNKNKVLLFIDYAVPMYDKYAGSRTNFMYLELLVKLGLTVKFLPADFKQVEPYTSELKNLGIETLDGNEFHDHWEDWFVNHGQNIDFVFFNKPEPTIKFLGAVKKYTSAAIIYQCHDLHYLRLQRKAEIEQNEQVRIEAERFEQLEKYIFDTSDVILTFSSIEEGIITSLTNKPVFTVPLYFYDSVAAQNVVFAKTHDLLFVGSCVHTPNRDAIIWFCEEVMPLIVEQLPDVVLNIVGANPPNVVLDLQSPNVNIVGGVSDTELNGLYAESRLAVVPLRFGAGVKGKTIEALYHGVPLVSTSIGLEGIKGIESIASGYDTADDFAAQVVELYTHQAKWTEFSKQGTAFVANHLTSSMTAKLLDEVLASAQEEKQKRDVAAEPPKLIAFYLPQYHPIPENDEWWGKGFTEWRNVAKAKPLFPGHYQPHLPADLGFYDLRSEETRISQAQLAHEYGLHGFCFYHYWFNGKQLLERPVEDMLTSGRPDFPFCLCWANENWTRRWDGEDQQVLMQQNYSEADDREHIRDLMRFFKDERYIRVDGKPMFLVYRTENMPDPARTADIWREEARSAGIGDLYLVRVESIGKCDPVDINFDAALEFAPDWWNKGRPQKKYVPIGNETAEELEQYAQLYANNYVHTYDSLVNTMLAKSAPDYKWMQCVTPSWDNTARRKDGAHIFLNSTPEKYQFWLEQVILSTKRRLVGDEKIVFVNAWNEWAEGNHLEPDLKFGRAYLEATRDALHVVEPAIDVMMAPGSNQAKANKLVDDTVEPMEMSVLQQQITHLRQLLEERDRQLKTMAQVFEERNSLLIEIKNLTEIVDESETRIDTLEKMLAERNILLSEILNSKSWKLTKPLRWVFKLFKLS